MGVVVVAKSLDVASPREALWPLLADTDRMNRLLGTSPIQLRPSDRPASGARFVVETRTGGFALEYEEQPFEWVQGRSFSVLREVRKGPIESYRLNWALETLPTAEQTPAPQTRVSAQLEIVPRFWPIHYVARVQASQVLTRAMGLVQELDAFLTRGAPSPFARPVTPVNEARLAAGLSALAGAGVAPALIARIEALLQRSSDAELARIRPFEIADRVGEGRRPLLAAMLHSVVAGLLELRWAVVCPSCLGPSAQHETLAEIGAEGHCQLCDISFDLDLDRAVEATFFPHPSVRASSDQLFCMGGPGRMPHVLSQVIVPPASTRPMDGPLEPGRYRLFGRGGAVASLEVEAGAAERVEAVLDFDGARPATLRIAPGGALSIANATEEARHVKVERLGYASAAATAHIVSTLEEFRGLFSSDLLKRSTPLKVSRVAILFSDLTGSTALYSQVGDAAAFRLVDDHFDVVRGAVVNHEGVLVKTMGDAVMAAFTDTTRCVRAALEILARFEQFRRAHPYGASVGIKLGLHAGPCYVVSANGQLDYFGQTVNVASRVQHLADSGELVLGVEHLDGLISDVLEGVSRGERFEARVKGVSSSLALVRMRLLAGAPELCA